MTAASPAPPMSPNQARPDTITVFLAVYGLLLRSIATRGRLIGIGALAGVSLVTALLVNSTDPYDSSTAALGFVNGNLSTLLPVAVLVFGSAAIGDLVDDGSLVYLWLRPVRPSIHVVAAIAATLTVVTPLVGLPVVLATAMIDSDPDVVSAAVVGGLVALVAYSALFVAAGIRLRRPLPWGLVYILIWEGFVASAGETAGRLAIRGYVRSILSQMTGLELKLANVNLASGIIVPLVVAVAAAFYGSRRLARTDVA
ncbi:MAG: hypothetical protein ABI239_06840 [Aquihabitans sp.]